MIDFLIKSTVCLIAFIAFYHLFLEREKMHKFNRFYLLFSIIISFIIPFLSFEIIQIVPVVSVVQNIEQVKFQTFSAEIKENHIKESVIPLKKTINYLPYILWSLYGLISIVLVSRFGKNCFKLISKSKSNPIIKYKNAKLILINEKTLPHTFLNFIFINFEDYNSREIEDELYTHELVHVTQKHTLDILFIEFLKCIFWFNPTFFFFKKAIQLNHEFLADEKVVTSFNNIPFYQNLLLKKSSNIQTIYLASNLNYLVTKKRLIMMTKSTSKKMALAKKIAIIPILAGLVYFFSVEIVAQEKVTSAKPLLKKETINNKGKALVNQAQEREVEYLTYKVSDEEYYKDVVCVYYENVEGNDMNKWSVKNILFSKKYQELSKDEIEKLFLKFRQAPTVKKSPTQEEINDFKNSKKYAIWIDGAYMDNSKLDNYKPSDFASFSGSVILKNARTKKHPQPFQYWFYTLKYYKEHNMDKWLSRYPSDSLVIGINKKKEQNLNVDETKKKKIIVIDAGHGGHDFGVQVNDELESKIVENIAKKISLLNQKGEIEIILLREDDHFIELKERVNKINKINPDLLISLHINSSKETKENGVHAYVSKHNNFYEKSLESAKKLIGKISNEKFSEGEVKDGSFVIINNSKCPAILLEVGFLSNENDRTYITSEIGKNEIANRILAFLKQY